MTTQRQFQCSSKQKTYQTPRSGNPRVVGPSRPLCRHNFGRGVDARVDAAFTQATMYFPTDTTGKQTTRTCRNHAHHPSTCTTCSVAPTWPQGGYMYTIERGGCTLVQRNLPYQKNQQRPSKPIMRQSRTTRFQDQPHLPLAGPATVTPPVWDSLLPVLRRSLAIAESRFGTNTLLIFRHNFKSQNKKNTHAGERQNVKTNHSANEHRGQDCEGNFVLVQGAGGQPGKQK